MFGTEKNSSRKEKIQTAINEVCSVFSFLSNGYMHLLVAQESVAKFEFAINGACVDIKERAGAFMRAAVLRSRVVQKQQYATVVSASTSRPAHSVFLATGKTFNIRFTERVIIGPRNAETSRQEYYLAESIQPY